MVLYVYLIYNFPAFNILIDVKNTVDAEEQERGTVFLLKITSVIL